MDPTVFNLDREVRVFALEHIRSFTGCDGSWRPHTSSCLHRIMVCDPHVLNKYLKLNQNTRDWYLLIGWQTCFACGLLSMYFYLHPVLNWQNRWRHSNFWYVYKKRTGNLCFWKDTGKRVTIVSLPGSNQIESLSPDVPFTIILLAI